jgi:hypothetical protein
MNKKFYIGRHEKLWNSLNFWVLDSREDIAHLRKNGRVAESLVLVAVWDGSLLVLGGLVQISSGFSRMIVFFSPCCKFCCQILRSKNVGNGRTRPASEIRKICFVVIHWQYTQWTMGRNMLQQILLPWYPILHINDKRWGDVWFI